MPLLKVTERNSEDKPIVDAEEKVLLEQENVSLFLQEKNEGSGNLYLTNKRIFWLNKDDKKSSLIHDLTILVGYSMDFYFITCHAIARAGSFDNLDKPCIYCQLDVEEEPNDEDEEIIYECRFIPDDASTIDKLFNTFSECAMLNPDPANSDDDAELIYNETEVNNGLEVTAHDILTQSQQWDSLFVAPSDEQLQKMLEKEQEGQFDDPDEEEVSKGKLEQESTKKQRVEDKSEAKMDS